MLFSSDLKTVSKTKTRCQVWTNIVWYTHNMENISVTTTKYNSNFVSNCFLLTKPSKTLLWVFAIITMFGNIQSPIYKNFFISKYKFLGSKAWELVPLYHLSQSCYI